MMAISSDNCFKQCLLIVLWYCNKNTFRYRSFPESTEFEKFIVIAMLLGYIDSGQNKRSGPEKQQLIVLPPCTTSLVAKKKKNEEQNIIKVFDMYLRWCI